MFNETAYDLAAGAGCSPEGARIAAAIAQAESGGNPSAYNPETAARGGTPLGKGSYGLWQIYLKQHPEFAGWNLYDPATNARAMFSVSGGCRNWRPWSTYPITYRQFLQPAPDSGGAPIPAGSGGESAGGAETPSGGGFLETLTMPVDFFSGAPAWLPVVALAAAAYFILK